MIGLSEDDKKQLANYERKLTPLLKQMRNLLIKTTGKEPPLTEEEEIDLQLWQDRIIYGEAYYYLDDNGKKKRLDPTKVVCLKGTGFIADLTQSFQIFGFAKKIIEINEYTDIIYRKNK